MQQPKPDDYVIATGKNHTVKEFINKCAKILKIKIYWKGEGIKTKAYDAKGNCIIECSKKYFRPAEVDILLGDSTKAKKLLKWKPKISFENLVKEMINDDLQKAKKLLD